MIRIREILEEIKFSSIKGNETNIEYEDNELVIKPLKDNSIIENLFKDFETISVAEFITICNKIEGQNEKCYFILHVLKSHQEELSEEEQKLVDINITPIINLQMDGMTNGFNLDNNFEDNNFEENNFEDEKD
jgi:hypothetical protein